jgi:hypothetical protein
MKILPVGTEMLGEKLVPDMKCEVFVKTYRLTLLKRVAIFSVSKEIKLKLIKTLMSSCSSPLQLLANFGLLKDPFPFTSAFI